MSTFFSLIYLICIQKVLLKFCGRHLFFNPEDDRRSQATKDSPVMRILKIRSIHFVRPRNVFYYSLEIIVLHDPTKKSVVT